MRRTSTYARAVHRRRWLSNLIWAAFLLTIFIAGIGSRILIR